MLQTLTVQNVSANAKIDWPIIAVLLWGALLRLADLGWVGLEHDEVANWLIDRDILAGQHGIYFDAAYGHEAGYHYVQTLFVRLLGDHALALRLPSAFLGVLLIAVSYTLVKRLYANRKMALVAALILAVTFFPIFYSRLALRAIMLPVLSGLSAFFFWGALHRPKPNHFRNFVIAGLVAGLCTYTYMASRVVPIFFALFIGYLFIANRALFQERQRGLLGFVVTYLIVAAPLFIWLEVNPSAEFRVTEINAPLEAARNGDLSLMVQNAWKIVGVWGWSGDPLWRQNVANAPIFNRLTAIAFYIGIVLMTWRHRLNDVFVLLWLATATIPSIVTTDAPSTIRMINMLPLLGVPISVTFSTLIHKLSSLSTKYPRLSTVIHKNSWITLLTIVFILGSSRSFNYVWRVWPASDEVVFVWQRALTNAAAHLDATKPAAATIIGWTPDSMDPPTMQLAMVNDTVDLRFAAPNSLVVPLAEKGRVQVLRPSQPDLPLDPQIEQWLTDNGATQAVGDGFVAYSLQSPAKLFSAEQLFSEQLAFVTHSACVNVVCPFITEWQSVGPLAADLSVFVHVRDAGGAVVSQSDARLAPARHIAAGDYLVAAHLVDLSAAAEVVVGLYQTQTGQRLMLPNGEDAVVIQLNFAEP